MGDFNCNLLNPADNSCTQFINLVHSYSYRPLHSIPTRVTSHCASLLDVIFTNSLCLNSASGVSVDDISDHFPVFTLANLDVAASRGASTYFIRDLNPHSLELLRSTIQNESWTDVLQSSDVDSAFDCFSNIFLNHLNNCLPWVAYTKRSTHQTSKYWITPAILNSCKTKNRLYKKFLRSRSTINLNEYKCFRNGLTSVIDRLRNLTFPTYSAIARRTRNLCGAQLIPFYMVAVITILLKRSITMGLVFRIHSMFQISLMIISLTLVLLPRLKFPFLVPAINRICLIGLLTLSLLAQQHTRKC